MKLTKNLNSCINAISLHVLREFSCPFSWFENNLFMLASSYVNLTILCVHHAKLWNLQVTRNRGTPSLRMKPLCRADPGEKYINIYTQNLTEVEFSSIIVENKIFT